MNDTPIAGILLADKPAGISSHAVVARARRTLAMRRVGHAGTLDPFATGLVIVLVGRATRLARWFVELPKTYEALARLGWTSTTGDVEGDIAPGRVPPLPLALPAGVIAQRPPAYSAIHVGGERAYVRARRGESFELPTREVEIHECEELWREGERCALRVVCSSGTYIRTLVADLGDAYCLALRRTAIGPFAAAGAWPTEGPATVLDVTTAWRAFGGRVITLEADRARAATHGRRVAGPLPGGGDALLVDEHDVAIAVAASERDGELRPLVGLRG